MSLKIAGVNVGNLVNIQNAYVLHEAVPITICKIEYFKCILGKIINLLYDI